MRIGIIVTISSKKTTGVGIYTVKLIKSLLKINDGDKIYVFTRYPLQCLENRDNLQIIRTLPLPTPIFIQFQIPFLAKKYDIDVLHGPNFFLPIFDRTPKIVTVHDLSSQLFPHLHKLSHRVHQKLLYPSLKIADKIIAVSKSTAKDLENFYNLPHPKIEVIPNGVSPVFTPAPHKKRVQIRKKYNLPQKFLLFVGTLEPRKNIANLIRAYDLVKDKIGRIPLVIAGGEGWHYKTIYSLVEELNLENEIFFPGYIPKQDLPALYSAAYVFCYPSLYEGFGLPPLEAAACGTPVLTSNVSSIPEVMHGAAELVDPHDSTAISVTLEKLVLDENLRNKLIKKGKARADKFTWQRTAKMTLKVYREMAKKK